MLNAERRLYCICLSWMYLADFRLPCIHRKSRNLYQKSSAYWIGKHFHVLHWWN